MDNEGLRSSVFFHWWSLITAFARSFFSIAIRPLRSNCAHQAHEVNTFVNKFSSKYRSLQFHKLARTHKYSVLTAESANLSIHLQSCLKVWRNSYEAKRHRECHKQTFMAFPGLFLFFVSFVVFFFLLTTFFFHCLVSLWIFFWLFLQLCMTTLFITSYWTNLYKRKQ